MRVLISLVLSGVVGCVAQVPGSDVMVDDVNWVKTILDHTYPLNK